MDTLRHLFTDKLGQRFYIALYSSRSVHEALDLAASGYGLLLINFDTWPLQSDDPFFQAIRKMPLASDDKLPHLRVEIIGHDFERIHDLIDSAIIARARAAQREPDFVTLFGAFEPTTDRRQFGVDADATSPGEGTCILVRGVVDQLAEVAGGVIQYHLEHEFAPPAWRYTQAELEEMQAQGLQPEQPPVLRRFFVGQNGTRYYVGFYSLASVARVLSDPARYTLKIVNCEPYRLPEQEWLCRTLGHRVQTRHEVPPIEVLGRMAEEIAPSLERVVRRYSGEEVAVGRYDCVDLREVAQRCAARAPERDQAILVCGDNQELGLVAGEIAALLLRKEFTGRSEPAQGR